MPNSVYHERCKNLKTVLSTVNARKATSSIDLELSLFVHMYVLTVKYQ